MRPRRGQTSPRYPRRRPRCTGSPPGRRRPSSGDPARCSSSAACSRLSDRTSPHRRTRPRCIGSQPGMRSAPRRLPSPCRSAPARRARADRTSSGDRRRRRPCTASATGTTGPTATASCRPRRSPARSPTAGRTSPLDRCRRQPCTRSPTGTRRRRTSRPDRARSASASHWTAGQTSPARRTRRRPCTAPSTRRRRRSATDCVDRDRRRRAGDCGSNDRRAVVVHGDATLADGQVRASTTWPRVDRRRRGIPGAAGSKVSARPPSSPTVHCVTDAQAIAVGMWPASIVAEARGPGTLGSNVTTEPVVDDRRALAYRRGSHIFSASAASDCGGAAALLEPGSNVASAPSSATAVHWVGDGHAIAVGELFASTTAVAAAAGVAGQMSPAARARRPRRSAPPTGRRSPAAQARRCDRSRRAPPRTAPRRPARRSTRALHRDGKQQPGGNDVATRSGAEDRTSVTCLGRPRGRPGRASACGATRRPARSLRCRTRAAARGNSRCTHPADGPGSSCPSAPRTSC